MHPFTYWENKMSRQSKTKPSNKVDKDQKKINQKKLKKNNHSNIKRKLPQPEKKYHEFIENLNDVIYTISIEGIITYVSRTIFAILSYTPSELIGTKFTQLIHPDHKEQINMAFKDVLLGKLYPSEYRLIAKNGKEKWVRTSSRPIYEQGKVIGLQGILTDITERKHAEQKLKESEERFRKIFDESLIGIVVVSKSFVFEKVNPAFCKMMEYTALELCSMTFIDITHPNHQEQDKENVIKVGKGEIPFYQTEKRYITKSGKVIWGKLIVTSIRDDQGGLQYYLTLVEDITERKQAEESLKKSEFRLNRAELISRLGNFEIDLKTGIITASSGAKKIYGVEGNDRQLSDIQKMTLGEYREYLDNALKNLIEKNIPYNVEFKIKKYDTGEILDIHSIAEYDGENKIVYGMVQDITDHKRTEEALRKSEAKYRALNELITDYTFEFLISPDGSISLAETSENFERITGRSKEGVSTIDSWKTIFHPEDLPKVMADLGLLVRDGRPLDLECRTFVHQGTMRWINIVAKISHFDNNARPTAIIGSVKDITERKKAEEELKNERMLLNNIMETSPIGITTVDSSGKITYANTRAVQILGLTKDEISQRTYNAPEWKITDFDGNPFPDENLPFSIVMKTGISVFNIQHAIELPDSNRIYLSINASPLLDEKGNVTGMVASIEDITERKHVEQKLKESEEQFRRLFMSMSEGFYLSEIIYDEKGNPYDYKYLEVNPKFEEILGLSRDKIIGRTYREIVPVDTTQWFDTYIKVARTGIPSYYDFYSKEYNMYFSTYSYKTAKNQITVFVMNITERKKTEEALRDKENQLSTLSDNLPDGGVYQLDMGIDGHERRFTYLSAGMSRLHEVGIDAVLNDSKLFYNQIIDKDFTLLIELEAKAFASMTPFTAEVRFRAPNGEIRWILLMSSPRRLPNQHIIWDGIELDITERKHAEQKLKESEERFRKLLQSVTDYIYTVNVVNGKTVSIHHGPACISVTGYTSEEFSNDPFLWHNIIHKDDKKSTIEITDKITKGESISAFEHRIIHKSGTIRWVRNTPVIRRKDKGEVIEYDGLITDITEKKAVEEEIIKLNLELEARVQERTMELALANKELEAFSYSVSHDLKSPLRTISGFSCLALEKIDKKDSELLSHLNKIYSASDKMSKLIDDLLNLSRITQQEINKMTFDISELVKKIFDELCEQYSNLKIEFNYQKKIKIMADFDLVKIMIKNLLNNALKFSSKKSKIRIEFGSIKEIEKLTFFIKDNGDGFDMKYADKIFTPFQRIHSDKEFEGTGIGLAIVQRIVKKHGGNVWIESKKEAGTTVFFNL